MTVAIFGAGTAGHYLYDEIKKNAQDVRVAYFIDNKLSGGEIDGCPIYKPTEAFGKHKQEIDSILIAAGAQKTLKYMINICRENGIYNLYMLQDIAGKEHLPLFRENAFDNTRVRKLKFSKEKPSLHYFEVPITDSCNLNCKGCLFACNAVSGEQHVPIEQLVADAKRMSELFYDVPWIRILGGEPLLHPDLIELLTCYRKYFPDSEIDLCTNGLLIPRMGEDFWNCIKNNRISIHVSGYKPTYSILEKIDSVLSQHNIVYTILKRDEFLRYYTDKPTNDIYNSYEKCIASGCYELYRGKLFTCSAIIAYEHFNKIFDMDYEIVEGEDWADIHREDADAFELKKLLESPSGACAYCDVEHMEKFGWEKSYSKKNYRDFMVGEE